MLTVVWDVDDVLNPFMRCWFEDWWCVRNPGCTLRYQDITTNPPNEILGVALDAYRRSIDEFRFSDAFMKMKPDPVVYNWFVEHGHFYKHIALTAVSREAVSASAGWTFKHFGDWIRSFVFVPSQRNGQKLPKYDSNKCDCLRWFTNADVFIEDNPHNTEGLKNDTIRSFIVARPWNSSNCEIDTILSELIDMRNNEGRYKRITERNTE